MATRTISNAGGSYNSTATWVEGVVPTSVDDVVATATSGNLTVSTTAQARSLDLAGYSGTLAMNGALTLGSSTARGDLLMLRFSPTMGMSGSQEIVCGGTYTGDFVKIDPGGKNPVTIRLNFNTNGRWRFVSDLVSAVGNSPSHSNGYLDFGGVNITASQLNVSGVSPRTINFSTGVISIGATNISGSNLTLIPPAVYTVTNWFVVTHPGLTFRDVVLAGAGARYTQGSFTCANLIRVGTGAHNDYLKMEAGSTIIVTGTFTVTDGSGTGIWVGTGAGAGVPVSATSPATVELGATGVTSLTNVDFSDVRFMGANTPVSGTRLGDALGNSGIVFDASRTLYWVGGAGNWSDAAHWSLSSGGSSGQLSPKPQDDVVLDNASFTGNSQRATTDYSRLGRNVTVNVTNRTGISFGNGNGNIFGSHASNLPSPATTLLTFRGRGSHTLATLLTTTTYFVQSTATVDALSGTYTLADSLLVSALTILSGTLALDGRTLRTAGAGDFIATTGLVPRRLDLGAGTLQVDQSDVLLGSAVSNFTLAGSGTIQMSVTGSRSLTTNGTAVPRLLVTGGASTTVRLVDNLTAGAIDHIGGTFDLQGRTVITGSFTSTGTTTRTLTMGASNFTVNGPFTLSGSGLTVNPVTSTITVVGGPFAANGLTLNAVTLRSAPTGRITAELPASTVGALTLDGGNVVVQGGFTVTGALTASGSVNVYGPDWGGQATISAAVTTLTNATFNRIVSAGTGSWTGAGLTVIDDGWTSQAVEA